MFVIPANDVTSLLFLCAYINHFVYKVIFWGKKKREVKLPYSKQPKKIKQMDTADIKSL